MNDKKSAVSKGQNSGFTCKKEADHSASFSNTFPYFQILFTEIAVQQALESLAVTGLIMKQIYKTIEITWIIESRIFLNTVLDTACFALSP